MDDRPSSNDNQNAGTMLALVGLTLIAVFLFGLVALVLPNFIFLFVVLAFLFFLGTFQYIILGWWFSRRRFEEHERDDPD